MVQLSADILAVVMHISWAIVMLAVAVLMCLVVFGLIKAIMED